MADLLKFFRVLALPPDPLPDAIYLVKTGPDTADFIITGNDGTPHTAVKGPQGDPSTVPGPQGEPGQSGVLVTAAVPLGGHRVVTVFGQYAEPGDEDILAGITTGAVSAGAQTYAVREGIIEESSWSWTPSQPIFVASSGLLTQSAPTSSRIRRVAWALTSTTINVDFFPAIELI